MKFLILLSLGVVAASTSNQVLEDFANGNNLFIDELYKGLVKRHSGNFLVCPLSVQTVFGLLHDGAKGNTAKQIKNGLRLPEDEFKRAETFYRLGLSLQANHKYTLSSANKMYVANNFLIGDNYKARAVKVFHSDIQNIDFGKARQAVSEINRWVEQKTHGKIKNLLSEDMVDTDTAVVLINALYFQGKWVTQFKDVITMPFYHEKHVTYINMMTVTEEFDYFESWELKAKFLELPYEGDEMTMTIVLPDDIEGLSALENQIAHVLVAPKYELERVNVNIPKFKIDTTISLIPVLESLGITDAFTSAADFSGIGAKEEGLIVSEVVQKTFIEVDEKGTTAAAATAGVVANRIGGTRDLSFVANHPFIFYLKHKVNGVIFIGRYALPEDGGKP